MSEMTFGDLLLQKDGLIKGPFGGDIKKSLFVPKTDDTYKVYEQGVVLNRDINRGDYYVSKEYFEKKLKRFEVKENDILLTGAGTLGELFIVPPNAPKGIINQALLRVRLNKEVVDQNFFCYYFKYYVKSIISNINGDSVIPNLPPLPIIKSTVIDIPDISYQQKIAAVLTALDAKIELNARINAELESMAKTLYDYWFVQFAYPHPSSPKWDMEALQNSQNSPVPFGGGAEGGGGLVWNEELKREIPKDWKVESIENCCDIVDCLHAKKPDYEFEDEKYYLLQLENIRDDGLLDLTNKYFVPKDEYQKWISRIEVTEDDILITNAGRVAATAQIPKGIKTGIGRNITAIRPKSVSPTYLFSFFRSADMIRQVRWNMDAGAFFSSLNVKGIKKLHIIRPSGDIEEQFENIVKPMRRKREELNVESQTLTELRDWLLPMLMNGQIQMS